MTATTAPTSARRHAWKRPAGVAALWLAGVALIAGPLAALYVDNNAEQEIRTLDRTGTDRAVTEVDRLDNADANITARLDALDSRVEALEQDAHEFTELLADLDDPTGSRTGAGVEQASASPEMGWDRGPDVERFDALAACESTGDDDGRPPHNIKPDAVSGSGKYHGAHQWAPSTWDAANGVPEHERASSWPARTGDPIDHPYEQQRSMAMSWAARPDVDARSQWPTCWPLVMGDHPY